MKRYEPTQGNVFTRHIVWLNRIVSSETAATSAEYATTVALTAMAAIAGVTLFGDTVTRQYNSLGDSLTVLTSSIGGDAGDISPDAGSDAGADAADAGRQERVASASAGGRGDRANRSRGGRRPGGRGWGRRRGSRN